jgi:ubiquinone biosynthesis protein UbiJ
MKMEARVQEKAKTKAQALFACTVNRIVQRQPERLRVSLKPFQGKTLRLVLGMPSIDVMFKINGQGGLEGVEQNAHEVVLADVSIQLKGGVPFLTALSPPFSLENLLAQAHIAGNAEFAEALSFLVKNISLHPGDFLQPIFGDVLTHRLEQALTCSGQHLLNTASLLVQKLSR